MKEHLELFKKLLEDFTEDPSCLFFCNESDAFHKLWGNGSFKQSTRSYAKDFVDLHYPEHSKSQPFEYENHLPLLIGFDNNNSIRIEFLNWLIPQL